MPAYSVPSGNISGMTFGGSSLAPKTSIKPKRRPTYAETQSNESAADQGGGQDNNPNNIASDFQPNIASGNTYKPAAGSTPTFMLNMTPAESGD